MRKNALIGSRVQENSEFLKSIIKTCSEKKRCSILKGATAEELLALVEICHNILRSRFRLSARQKERLSPHAAFIRKLGSVRSEHSARTAVQKGAGFPYRALLRPVLSEAGRQIVKTVPSAAKK